MENIVGVICGEKSDYFIMDGTKRGMRAVRIYVDVKDA